MIGRSLEILEKKVEILLLHFSMLLDILGCLGTFWGAGGGEAPCGGQRPPQEQEARRSSMFLYIYIYMNIFIYIYIYIVIVIYIYM